MEFKIKRGTTFARIRFEQIRGEAALGFCRLFLRFGLDVVYLPKDDENTRLTDLCGDLRIGRNYVGRLLPHEPPLSIRTFRAGMNDQFTLVTELDHRRVDAIEDLRPGGDLKFDITLRGAIRGGGEEERVEERGAVPVNQSQWIEVLRGLEYDRRMLLEIPVADESASPKMAEAARRLKKAQDAIFGGEYPAAVGCCREALEALSCALGDAQQEKQATFQNLKGKDKHERLRLVRHALRVLCSPPHHADERAAAIEWTRKDAVAAMAMVAALLQQLSTP